MIMYCANFVNLYIPRYLGPAIPEEKSVCDLKLNHDKTEGNRICLLSKCNGFVFSFERHSSLVELFPHVIWELFS